jgi:anti-anti-sigma factor
LRRVPIDGELDMAREESLIAEIGGLLDDPAAPPVELDLGQVSFVDSSGVRALMRLVHLHGDRVRLGAMSESARRVLDIAGLIDWLDERSDGGGRDGD